jgi:hypothetical protein
MLKKKLPIARKAIIGAALIPGILLGGVVSVSAAQAVPATSSHSAVSVTAAAETRELRLPAGTASAVTGAADVAPGTTASGEKRINIGPVVSWIKSNVGWLWNGLVNAVRSGWGAFLNWWNSLAGWIRWSIEQVAGAGVGAIFEALRHYLFGW